MEPIAKGIDYIQGERASFLGCLIPTIINVLEMLYKLQAPDGRDKLKYATSAAKILYTSVQNRFAYIFEEEACLLATASHPVFRVGWLQCCMPQIVTFRIQDKSEQVTELLTREIASIISTQDEDMDTEAFNSEEQDLMDEGDADSFNVLKFSSYQAEVDEKNTNNTQATAKTIAETWLRQTATKGFTREAFSCQDSLQKIFLKYNTPLPSSGAVERMFSIAKDIARSKRNKLSDYNVNTLLFLKGNL